MAQLAPFYRQVQSHYDLSDDFYSLFLDPSMTYSCAFFERAGMSLEEAQRAKIDLALGKLGLEPGMTLLDIGCGWGSNMIRAVLTYGVRVIGLTLSRNQFDYVQGMLRELGITEAEVRLQGWEEFEGTADRIVSIGAFEHFRKQRYAEFFTRCHRLLPADGRMLLHTIIGHTLAELRAADIPVTREDALFHIFIKREIFPGGQLPQPDSVTSNAEAAGFRATRIQALRPHYARTLDLWAQALESHHAEAVHLTSEEVYQRYLRYLAGCAHYFRAGHLDVMQFTLQK
ncbi:cyclopropane mycolic acid synthase family methyltransferase [Nocardia seriolae]|uniref:Cyclopropane-fatty-acyl-phospholipid synthase n=1 Tax=Nocardia seriolae TaxID=37332 RepID=A0A0B8NHJ1_9NOCA|nr:cyclopropane mycolic acid synthase family methyltransferase [Nocardia seriolae]APA99449.1 Cyclopropane-fatty-acyl-phospholipid synthase [Nocardia seriolae]MTJ63168.1 methyltransferase domain-containing protein [Nocardia seriolae]MTJ76316.1 methyltransferase domain-containing protein [Nocardia seriolae]MTJ89027.1 methyltransferase domain-containing protein [Nocardia seriolae]MTK33007.1 methyltransferase domain-containing protein [Nocardia seriolae]